MISIGNSAFARCTSLTSVDIPNRVTSIGNSAFEGCSALTSVTLPSVVLNSNITDLIWGKQRYSVMSIGNSAFYGCSGLTSVMIPSSVTSIGSSAFEGCSGLTSVTISGSKTSIGSNVFKDCNNIFTVDFNSKTIMSDMSSKYGFKDIFGTQVQEYIVGDSINNISSSSFAGCSSLATITIGNSVTSVGGSAFKDCTGLKKVVVKDLAAWFGISFGGSSSNPLYYAHHLYDTMLIEPCHFLSTTRLDLGSFPVGSCCCLE